MISQKTAFSCLFAFKPGRKLLLAVLGIAFIAGGALNAQAEPKPWIWSWKNSHWQNQDFMPYLEPPKWPHNSQWNDEKWRPEDWLSQRDSATTLIKDFYFSGIVTAQYVKDTVAVLEVGPAFYRLGGYDKRRLAETFDYVYGITAREPYGLFMLYDSQSKEAVGVYTQHGLQLQ